MQGSLAWRGEGWHSWQDMGVVALTIQCHFSITHSEWISCSQLSPKPPAANPFLLELGPAGMLTPGALAVGQEGNFSQQTLH